MSHHGPGSLLTKTTEIYSGEGHRRLSLAARCQITLRSTGRASSAQRLTSHSDGSFFPREASSKLRDSLAWLLSPTRRKRLLRSSEDERDLAARRCSRNHIVPNPECREPSNQQG